MAIENLVKYMRMHAMSRGTMVTYMTHIKRVCKHLERTPGQLVEELSHLDQAALQKWFTSLAEYYLVEKSNPVKGMTMRSTHFAVLLLLRANRIDAHVKIAFKTHRKPPVPFTKQEVRAILRQAGKSKRDTLWIWLLCQSFSRVGLIHTLTYGDFIELLEEGGEAGLVWIDGEKHETKERISHDIPVSPEVVRALRARRRDIEEKTHTKITRENAAQFPIAGFEKEPTKKLSLKQFIVEIRRIIHRAQVQGEGCGENGARRYTKDLHTGFRGFCMSQWKGNTWLANYFAGHKVTAGAFNYVRYETVEPSEKIAEYLRCRPQVFSDIDVVEEACIQLSNLGFQVDSKTRQLLTEQLPGGDRKPFQQNCLYSNRQDALERSQGRE